MAAQPNEEGARRARMLDPVDGPGIERVGPDGAALRVLVRTRPGAVGPAVARERRRRLPHELAEAGVRSAASREITLVPPAPTDGGPA